MTKPLEKYPFNYKCTHIYDIKDRLKKLGINLGNLQPDIPTQNRFHDFNFYDFINKRIQSDNTIFPLMRLKNVYTKHYNDLSDNGSVILLPVHYDSSNDEETIREQNKIDRDKLIELMKVTHKGDISELIENIDKNVNFGTSTYEWANIALTKIHEEYQQYYVDGFLKVWLPFDWDSITEYNENENENTESGYPISKLLFLSDIEKYLKDEFGLSDDTFYEFIVKNNYIEERHWERPLNLQIDEDYKFIKINGKYGMDATPNIDKMLSVLEVEFKDLIKKQGDVSCALYIYIDYYKEVKSKY